MKSGKIDNLVLRAQKGEQDAFNQLIQKHTNKVYRQIGIAFRTNDIDDIAQEVFINVFRSLNSFKGQSTFSTWLHSVTTNTIRQTIRSRVRLERIKAEAVNVVKVKEQYSVNQEEAFIILEEINRLLAFLPHKKREAYLLHTYKDYSLKKISILVGSPVSTIGSRIRSAQKEIKKKIERKTNAKGKNVFV